MISEETINLINKHVDDYISEIRLDFIYLENNRQIKELSPGKYHVRDSDLIVDRNQDYNEVLRHPVENTFIPEKVELFTVEYVVELQLPELKQLTNFYVDGDTHEHEFSIDDPSITDEQLRHLLTATYFNSNYLDNDLEVKEYLNDVYRSDHSDNVKKILERFRPLLGI